MIRNFKKAKQHSSGSTQLCKHASTHLHSRMHTSMHPRIHKSKYQRNSTNPLLPASCAEAHIYASPRPRRNAHIRIHAGTHIFASSHPCIHVLSHPPIIGSLTQKINSSSRGQLKRKSVNANLPVPRFRLERNEIKKSLRGRS